MVILILLVAGVLLAKPISKMLGSKSEPKDKVVVNQEVKEEPKELIDPDNPPKFIQVDFVELDKVFSISKFRSGMGHDYSVLSGEECRSMKHYFASMNETEPVHKYEGYAEEAMPIPTIEKDVKIFSPVDGEMTSAKTLDPNAVDNELIVYPELYPDISIRFQHVYKLPDFKPKKVKAGEVIGLVRANQAFDLAIETDLTLNGIKRMGYISYFAAMPDNIFAKYQARGAKNREDFIISREYRDAHPLSCHGKEVFDKDYPALDGWAAHSVHLSGFNAIEAKIKVKYPNPNILETRDTNPTRR